MISGACPPPAPSVWNEWIVRPLNALIVSSTKPASLIVSVWIATCTSYRSATLKQVSMAAGVVPQSSCSFSPMAPASTCSFNPSGSDELPLPRKPRLIGKPSAASSMRWMFQGPGVQVVAFVPVAGPVPPPISVVSPLASASVMICGQMKWMCVSIPPAVMIFPFSRQHLGAGPDLHALSSRRPSDRGFPTSRFPRSVHHESRCRPSPRPTNR